MSPFYFSLSYSAVFISPDLEATQAMTIIGILASAVGILMLAGFLVKDSIKLLPLGGAVALLVGGT